MAFIRAYSAQGDPRLRHKFSRMGVLVRGQTAKRTQRTVRAQRLQHARLLSLYAGRRGTAARRALTLAAGDPFRLRMPKFLRKLQVGKALGKVAKFAAPIVGTAILPGVGTALGALASSRIGQAVARGVQTLSNVSPELTTQPAPTGPTSAVVGGYMIPGTEVTPETSGATYNVFERRARVAQQLGPDDEDEDDQGEDDEDVSDVGDEDEDTDEGSD